MSTHFKKANLALVLILVISLYLPSNVKAASENSDLYRAPFGKKSPVNLSTGIDPSKVKLEWKSVRNVLQYRYCYYSYDLTDNICDIADKATWMSSGTSTSVQLPALGSGKTYYWQVGAKLTNHNFIYADGALSSKWSFTTGSSTVGAGIYDNTASNWVYTGKWVASTDTGPYNNTYQESRDIPDYATFTFTGSKFELYYTQKPDRGVMNIYMDNSTTPIALDQSGPLTWQKSWMSDPLASGTHTVKLVYVSGDYVDIDAIQIFDQADLIAPAQINPLSAVTGPNIGTVTLSWTAVGDDGTTGIATSYLVRYSTSAIDATNWASATPVTSGVPNPLIAGSPQSMTVNGLVPGVTYYFAVRAQDEEFNLGDMSNSPSAPAQSPTPMGAGTYDNTHVSWTYTGAWTTYAGSGPYDNTLHYTTTVGDTASFVFSGTQFTLTFTKNPSRGSFEVWLDGTLITTINAYNSILAWQQTYTSPSYAYGTHIVTIKHAGPTGTVIDVDAIQITP